MIEKKRGTNKKNFKFKENKINGVLHKDTYQRVRLDNETCSQQYMHWCNDVFVCVIEKQRVQYRISLIVYTLYE